MRTRDEMQAYASAYLRRENLCDGLRHVTVQTEDVNLELAYDYHSNEVVRRAVNGVETIVPPAAPAVKF